MRGGPKNIEDATPYGLVGGAYGVTTFEIPEEIKTSLSLHEMLNMLLGSLIDQRSCTDRAPAETEIMPDDASSLFAGMTIDGGVSWV